MTSDPRRSIAPAPSPSITALAGPFAPSITVDLEEWFHTCWVREYVDPACVRPAVVAELDDLIPLTLEVLGDRRSTWFVLGEVAVMHRRRIREIADLGHEIASHGFSHLRADWLSFAEFREQARRSKDLLEDITGQAVLGFRSPEWSLRRLDHPGLWALAELGYAYDSSLTRAVGAGDRGNPTRPVRLSWPGAANPLVEAPPLQLWRRVPAGGWPGRLAPAALLERALARVEADAGLPLLVVHPWELVDRPLPGLLTGGARLLHEIGRGGYRDRFSELLTTRSWTTLRTALGLGAPAQASA